LNQFTSRRDKSGAIVGERMVPEWMVKWGVMYIHHIFAGAALALSLAIPLSTFAQVSNELPATFAERYSFAHTFPQTPSEPASGNNVTTPKRAARPARPRPPLVVVPRSHLDAGTEGLPKTFWPTPISTGMFASESNATMPQGWRRVDRLDHATDLLVGLG
jgi:hypothetical protein